MDGFDVAVVGGGITGASAANQLAQRGFSTILLERGDIGGATSGRTSRLQYCGLSYFSTMKSIGSIIKRPAEAAQSLTMARRAMTNRSEFVRSNPERVVPIKFYFPLYKEGEFPLWQVKAGLSLLERLDPGGIGLDIRRLSPGEARQHPMLGHMRSLDRLAGVLEYTEYQFNWPERICVDAVLNAEENDAVIQAHTAVLGISQVADKSWILSVQPEAGGPISDIRAKALVNTAGVWVDQLAKTANLTIPTLNQGAKGVNVVFSLPPEFHGLGFETMTRGGEPFYIIPWDDVHYIGPRNKAHDGSPDGFRVDEQEIADLISEANYQFPSLGLRRDQMRYAWAGVRPRTSLHGNGSGAHLSMLHDLNRRGVENYYCYTGGLLMTHRTAGRTIADAVEARTRPSATAKTLRIGARSFPRDDNSSPMPAPFGDIRWGDLHHAASHEHVRDLEDIMFRRVRLGWSASMGAEIANDVAYSVRDALDWTAGQANKAADDYRNMLREQFCFSGI